jgi:hypothetical protein
MKVSIKDLQISMDLGNNGIDLDVYNTKDERLGDLRIGRGKLTWCKGKTTIANGKTKTWEELIAWFESP